MSNIETTYHVQFQEKEFGCICENNQNGYEDLEQARTEFEYTQLDSDYVRLIKRTEEILDTYEKPKEETKYKQISGRDKMLEFIKNCNEFELSKVMCCPDNIGLKSLNNNEECCELEDCACEKCWKYALKKTYEAEE